VNIDAEPIDPTMIWDISITTNTAVRAVSWRGSGTFDNNEFAPKVFTLTAGPHQLVVRGREANCRLETIAIVPVPVVRLLSATLPASPKLRITARDGKLQVSWPAEAGTYVLQRKYVASTGNDWADVTNFPAVVGREYVVVLPLDKAGEFIRLRRE
jgi:hypothetical protein